jgi:hypothetical protein
MDSMFEGASAFNQNLNSWNLSNIVSVLQIFKNFSGYIITPSNYTNIINKAASLNQSLT